MTETPDDQLLDSRQVAGRTGVDVRTVRRYASHPEAPPGFPRAIRKRGRLCYEPADVAAYVAANPARVARGLARKEG